ncbi:zinc ribbon domain-containing protein [Tomitella biformata]|uniref:zinc ribbon domain-containing protein n=1 Tax=Tomitella biformata TaxID=630403 RepID=UPI0004B0DD59|nr:C4-type zinc ribbon domain-containing protein [Tomitella biformata]
MKAESVVQSRLLDLANVDAELNRIKHRRKTLPEMLEVERLEADRIASRDSAVLIEINLEDLARDIRKLEGEVEAVALREKRNNDRMQAGGIPSKQLSELEHEVTSLLRRRGNLEDELLEVMERREAVVADHEHAGAQVDAIDENLIDARRHRDDAVADLDTAEERCKAQRVGLLGDLPEDLLALYEKERARTGIGAALLQARRCGACRIELDRAEMERIALAKPDEVIRCEQCGAVLVRTKESGLK